MNHPSHTRCNCRLCGSKDLSLALPLEPTPIGDNYLDERQSNGSEPLFNLDLYLCTECGHVQLRDVVAPDLLYPDFPYVTSVSVGLPEHFRRFAREVTDRYGVPAKSLVVEIGSNEGPMLRAFQEHGCRVLGVEPAGQIARAASAAGVPTVARYFTESLARELRAAEGPARVIAANNVLANIDNLDDVFAGVTALLDPRGILVMESSYWADVVGKGLIDTIYHEHISYFSVRPLARFLGRHGLELVEVQRIANKGGSIRIAAQLRGGPHPVSASVVEFLAREAQQAIHGPAAPHRCRQQLDQVRERLHAALGAGPAIGYGASVGTTTMLYEFRLQGRVTKLLDDNPRKFGKLSPGLHLRCKPATDLEPTWHGDIVVFAWRYISQILRQHPSLRHGRRLLLPLPTVAEV